MTGTNRVAYLSGMSAPFQPHRRQRYDFSPGGVPGRMVSELREFELDEQGGNIGETSGAGVSAVIDVLGQAFGVVTDRSAPGSGACIELTLVGSGQR